MSCRSFRDSQGDAINYADSLRRITAIMNDMFTEQDTARRGLLLLRHPCRFRLQVLASSPVGTRSRPPRQDRAKDGMAA